MELAVTAPVLDIQYFPSVVADADAALALFVREVAWRDDMRARRTASFGVPYNYSGQAYPACAMPPVIAAIAARAESLSTHPFDNCLCNRYDTGEHTMGFHVDSYVGLVPGSRIAIASFGASRTLVFRSLDRLHREAVVLEHGSILLMSEVTQRGWQHAIRREAGAGLRISATFRRFAG
jgi:alkylated DNA repair dioxygenase AlkB